VCKAELRTRSSLSAAARKRAPSSRSTRATRPLSPPSSSSSALGLCVFESIFALVSLLPAARPPPPLTRALFPGRDETDLLGELGEVDGLLPVGHGCLKRGFFWRGVKKEKEDEEEKESEKEEETVVQSFFPKKEEAEDREEEEVFSLLLLLL